MAHAKIFLALSALLSFSFSLRAQIFHLYDYPTVPGVNGGGHPDDDINDHNALIAAQIDIQQYYLDGAPDGPAILELEPGEYIIGNQQLWGYPSDPPDPDPTDLIWNPYGYPGGVPVQCPSMVQMQNGFKLKDCWDFTIQGTPTTSIRYRDCLYYGTFFRPEEDEIFSAVGTPCETCTQNPHSPDLLHAAVGAMFTFENCTGITISNVELNGNSDHAILGGKGNFDGNQTSYDGIVLDYSSRVQIDHVNAHHFGRDGLLILSTLPPFPSQVLQPAAFQAALAEFQLNHPGPDLVCLEEEAYTIRFDNAIQYSQFNWNGRQGISWTACSELTVTDCHMDYTGTGRTVSRPCAGLDIEGGGGPLRVRYGEFNLCHFLHNRGRGIHSDAGDCLGQQDFTFTNCIVKAGTEGDAILPNTRKMKFVDCEIYGNVGPFYEQAENLEWDPLFNVWFKDTKFYEEDDQWSYIKWFAQGPIHL